MTICNTPLPDGSLCRGNLTRTKDGPWIELSCDSCTYECCRHVDSTGPVKDTGENQDTDDRGRWWDR